MPRRWKEPDNTKWRLIEYEYAFCSVCGKSVWMGFDTTEQARNSWDEEHLYAYCPHCGTKMFTDDGGNNKK